MAQRTCHTCGEDVSQKAESRFGLVRPTPKDGKTEMQELDFCSPKCVVNYMADNYPDATGH